MKAKVSYSNGNRRNIKVKVNSIGLITITEDRNLNTDPCTK